MKKAVVFGGSVLGTVCLVGAGMLNAASLICTIVGLAMFYVSFKELSPP